MDANSEILIDLIIVLICEGSRPTSPRPRLRRESAQEIEDGEYPPGISVELGRFSRCHCRAT